MNPFFYFTRQTKSEIYEKKKTPAHVYKIDEAPNCIQSPQPKRKKNTMRKSAGLLSILLAICGLGLLFLGGALSFSILSMIGLGILIVGIIGALVSNAIERSNDMTLWSYQPTGGLPNPTVDEEQFPLGEYTTRLR